MTDARLTPLRAFLFDLDGVLTPTAEVHRRAWARLFEPVLEAHGVEPYTDADYFRHIDGKPRFDGVRDLLASRGLTLPEGTHEDAPEAETVGGLGNRKNAVFNAELEEHGVAAYPGSLAFLDAAERGGWRAAVVSSSRNAPAVLEAAGIADRFELVVDGQVAARDGIPGKPAPDTYLAAAERLGLTPADCVVVEDAESGVQAGRAGAFGLVLGVDRGVGAETLLHHGADLVVADLEELVPELLATPAAGRPGGEDR